MSGFFPTDLIREVKIRPGIYNKDALTAPRKEHRHQLWLEVAESLTPREEWESYTESEKEILVSEISNKWKNLRDHFYREVKLLENGEAHKKRKYIYFNEMEFVRPYVGYKKPPLKRQKLSIDSVNSTQEARDDGFDMSEFLKSKKKSETIPANSNTLKARQHKISSGKEVVIDNFVVLEKTDDSKNAPFKIRESDISFCLSLVPTLRQISEVSKLSAKIEILQILHRNMAQIECNEQELFARHDKSKEDNQSSDCEEIAEECGEEVDAKADPLNANFNTKVWW